MVLKNHFHMVNSFGRVLDILLVVDLIKTYHALRIHTHLLVVF